MTLLEAVFLTGADGQGSTAVAVASVVDEGPVVQCTPALLDGFGVESWKGVSSFVDYMPLPGRQWYLR